ncbi:MAG: nucleoside triphosphate pyrophosphohydrolase [Acidobacteriota bacterium]
MSKSFDSLVSVMSQLRAPGGCPWDGEQTHQSLSRYLLEEAYETFDAIQMSDETGDFDHLREELGDLLLQVVFHSIIGAEQSRFTLDEVIEGITKKLVLRHPHVFGNEKLERAQDVLDNWETLKANERRESGKPERAVNSVLDDVPIHFPALLEALKITEKAAKIGFDWKDVTQIFDKIDEESAELKTAIQNNDQVNVEEEIGDLIFAAVNLARRLGVEPETAVKRSNRKFRKRFEFIERSLAEKGRSPDDVSLEDLDALWDEAKAVR